MVPSVIFGASPRDARQNAGNDESNEDNGRGPAHAARESREKRAK
jgi:hypothetical protein